MSVCFSTSVTSTHHCHSPYPIISKFTPHYRPVVALLQVDATLESILDMTTASSARVDALGNRVDSQQHSTVTATDEAIQQLSSLLQQSEDRLAGLEQHVALVLGSGRPVSRSHSPRREGEGDGPDGSITSGSPAHTATTASRGFSLPFSASGSVSATTVLLGDTGADVGSRSLLPRHGNSQFTMKNPPSDAFESPRSSSSVVNKVGGRSPDTDYAKTDRDSDEEGEGEGGGEGNRSRPKGKGDTGGREIEREGEDIYGYTNPLTSRRVVYEKYVGRTFVNVEMQKGEVRGYYYYLYW